MWTIEELGLPYEIVPLNLKKNEHKTPAYLAINPTGKVPSLVDGDVVMSESLAMSLYIAQRYGMGKLWPAGDAAHARILQWTLWAASELEPVAHPMMLQMVFKKPEERDKALLTTLTEKIKPPLDVLTVYLERNRHLLGDAFTLADLQVACVMDYLMRAEFSLAPWTKVAAWYAGCQARPAYKKVQDLRAAAIQAAG
jgi:glutathione S-transferase